MLDIVEAQVQTGQVCGLVEPSDVGYHVVVEVDVCEGRGEIVGEFDAGDLVLAET